MVCKVSIYFTTWWWFIIFIISLSLLYYYYFITLLLCVLARLACLYPSFLMRLLYLLIFICICIRLKIYRFRLLILLCSFGGDCLASIFLGAKAIACAVGRSQTIVLNFCNNQNSAISIFQDFQYHEYSIPPNILSLWVSSYFFYFHSTQSHHQLETHIL